jgi:type IV pilus assembly protein PilA
VSDPAVVSAALDGLSTRGRRGPAAEAGFTLIELLVVMVVMAILAAIAIPVISAQRAKAADTAVRSDLSSLGKEIVSYFGTASVAPTLAVASGRYQLAGVDLGRVSGQVTVVTSYGAAATSTGSSASTAGWTPTAWCVALTDPGGQVATFKFSAGSGLETGQCQSPTTP